MGYDAFKLLLKVLAGSVKGVSRYIKSPCRDESFVRKALYLAHLNYRCYQMNKHKLRLS